MSIRSLWPYLIGLGLSFLVALLLIRWLRGKAPALGLMDRPRGDRHLHGRAVAEVGGVGITAAVVVTVAVLWLLVEPGDHAGRTARLLVPLGLGALAMHLLGLWDDRVDLAAGAKFSIQILVAVGVFLGGIRLSNIDLPVFGAVEFGMVASLFLTIVWLVGITNAFNLVDGADGLAGGAALFATMSMLVASFVYENLVVTLVLVAVAGALLAFLHYNFPPASVFLGDAGSLFLGFTLAGLGLASSTKASTAVAIAIPLVTLGLPVMDVLLAVVRRFLRGEPVTRGDRGHIHHRLLALGHAPRRVALIMWGGCGLFGVSSLILLSDDTRLMGIVFFLVGTVVIFGLQRLRIPELLELRRTVGRGMRQRKLISRNLALATASDGLVDAATLHDVLERLGVMLDDTVFDEAEMWISNAYLPASAAAVSPPGLHPTDGGYRWTWWRATGEVTDLAGYWEVKLPFVVEGGRQVGRLTLRRRLDAHLPGEIDTIAQRLLPGVAVALQRILASTSPGPGPSPADGTGPGDESPPRPRPVGSRPGLPGGAPSDVPREQVHP